MLVWLPHYWSLLVSHPKWLHHKLSLVAVHMKSVFCWLDSSHWDSIADDCICLNMSHSESIIVSIPENHLFVDHAWEQVELKCVVGYPCNYESHHDNPHDEPISPGEVIRPPIIIGPDIGKILHDEVDECDQQTHNEQYEPTHGCKIVHIQVNDDSDDEECREG